MEGTSKVAEQRNTKARAFMFNVGDTERSASYVARQIHASWVDNAAKAIFDRKSLHLPEDKKHIFYLKIYLYCEASVLRVLLTERHDDDRYEELLREFDKLIFPTGRTVEKLEALKLAVKDLDALFTEKKELSWCRNWFQSIGYDETNPEGLFVFGQIIGLNTSSLREMLHEIVPPKSK